MHRSRSAAFCIALSLPLLNCGGGEETTASDGSGAASTGGDGSSSGGESNGSGGGDSGGTGSGSSSGGSASGGASSGGAGAGGSSSGGAGTGGSTSGGTGNTGSGGTGTGGEENSGLELDPSYGTNGLVTTRFRDSSDDLVDVVRQSDGKLVAIGTNWSHSDVIVYRFNSDGTPDLTFNERGSSIISLGLESRALAVALQPDGKIVALMREYKANAGPLRTVVVRFDTDGAIDATWGSAGRIYLSGDKAALAVQPDGKVVVAAGGVVTRLTASGGFDATFGGTGSVSAWPTQLALTPTQLAIALDESGRIFVVSHLLSQNVGISCLTSGGDFDDTFDGDGGLETGLSSFEIAFTVQPDGKPLLMSALTASPVLARYDAQGELDSSFSSDGYVSLSGGDAQDIQVIGSDNAVRILVLRGSTTSNDMLLQFDLAGQPDAALDTDGVASLTTRNSLALLGGEGELVLAGYDLTKPPAYSDSYRIPRLTKVTASGAIDATWADSGKAIGHAAATLDEAHGLVATGDGSVIAVGRSNFTEDWQGGYVLAKYGPSGTLDASFGTGGIEYLDTVDAGLVARSVTLDSSGNVLVAGGSNGRLARFTSVGEPDGMFGTTGIAQLGGGYTYALVVDSQDRPIIGGSVFQNGKHVSFIARSTKLGGLDSNFGTSSGFTYSAAPASASTMSAVLSLALDAEGRILATGAGPVGLLTRYGANGEPDETFPATDGTAGVGRAIDVADDGKIVVAGTDVVNGWNYALDNYTASSKVVVARFLSTGAPDVSFANDGLYSAALPGVGLGSPFTTSVRVMPVGDAYVGGIALVGGVRRGFVLHLLEDGSPDSEFGTAGVLLAPLAGEASGVFALAHDGDDALFAGGFAYNSPSGRDFALLRLAK